MEQYAVLKLRFISAYLKAIASLTKNQSFWAGRPTLLGFTTFHRDCACACLYPMARVKSRLNVAARRRVTT